MPRLYLVLIGCRLLWLGSIVCVIAVMNDLFFGCLLPGYASSSSSASSATLSCCRSNKSILIERPLALV